MEKYLSEVEKIRLQSLGIEPGEWLGGGASSDVYAIGPYKGYSNLCIKYIRNARMKKVTKEFEISKRLYSTAPGRFTQVIDLVRIEYPDANDPKKIRSAAAIVMEKLTPVYCPDTSLRNLVKLFFDCAVCLAFMHILGLFHRDVKIENVLYSERTGSYILLDYNISCESSVTFTENSCRGTLYNIAPETLKGENSRFSDLYQLGMMMRRLIVGREFEIPDITGLDRRSLFDELYEIKSRLQPLPDDAYGNKDLIEIINKLTRFDRSERYSDYTELVRDIQSLIHKYDLDISRADLSPRSVFILAVREEKRSKLTKQAVCDKARAFLDRHQRSNAAVSVFTFSDRVFTTFLETESDHVDIVGLTVADESSDFLSSLYKHAEKAVKSGAPKIRVCVTGAEPDNAVKSPRIFRRRTPPKLRRSYMINIGGSCLDVSSAGISDITAAYSIEELELCLSEWFDTAGEDAS